MLRLLPVHRVSSTGQTGDDGEGLDRQRAATKAIALAHGAVLLPAVEVVVSGSDLATTPEWRNKVLPQLADRNVAIAADSIDRLLRAQDFCFQIFQDLLTSGTKVYTPGKIHDLASNEDGFMAGLLALVGGRERQEIRRRAAAGRESARRRGAWPCAQRMLPNGILFNRETKRWEYDPAAVEMVLWVFHQFAHDGRSLKGLARELGLPPQRITGWLKNPLYRGIMVWRARTGEQVETRVYGGADQLPQLVNDDLWRTVQARLKASSVDESKRRERGAPTTWASGVMYSGLAGHGPADGQCLHKYDLTASEHPVYSSGGPGKRRYGCACGHGGLDRCGLRTLRAEPVNANLDHYFQTLTSKDSAFTRALREAIVAPPAPDTTEARRRSFEKKLAGLDRRESRLTDLYLASRIVPERHDREQDQIRADREMLQGELATLEHVARPTEGEVDDMVKAMDWRWDPTWSHDRKRRWLLKYVSRLYITNLGIQMVVLRTPTDQAGQVAWAGEPMPWVTPVFQRSRPGESKATTAEPCLAVKWPSITFISLVASPSRSKPLAPLFFDSKRKIGVEQLPG